MGTLVKSPPRSPLKRPKWNHRGAVILSPCFFFFHSWSENSHFWFSKSEFMSHVTLGGKKLDKLHGSRSTILVASNQGALTCKGGTSMSGGQDTFSHLSRRSLVDGYPVAVQFIRPTLSNKWPRVLRDRILFKKIKFQFWSLNLVQNSVLSPRILKALSSYILVAVLPPQVTLN